ncbi:MAG: FkbM family methyltransferase [Planctomycetia bacterium]|nr:FkbM family methyltransferase [Planctomycetia bacterium]
MGLLTDWYRRLAASWNQPRHWQMRPGGTDRRVFRTVVMGNEYRLPARFGPHDVVLDIGAQTGSFACAVLRRGAGTVYCCEADEGACRLLKENLEPYGARARAIHGAVWKSDARTPLVHFHRTHDTEAGTGRVTDFDVGIAVPVIRFDELVEQIGRQHPRGIRLLKLDCAGSEWPILLTSSTLPRIDAICGEYHLGDFPAVFQVPGHACFTTALLQEYLQGQGFNVKVEHSEHDPRTGLFFAQNRRARQVAPGAMRRAS